MTFEMGGKILAFIFNAVAIGIWVLILAIMAWIYFGLKNRLPLWGRLVLALLVGGLLAAWPLKSSLEEYKKDKAAEARYRAADAHFQECCKKAGVKIYRTVNDVEGILLMKLRPKWDPYDQNMIDPYGTDYGDSAEGYIVSFLRGSDEKGTPVEDPKKSLYSGYRYVEVIDEDGRRYRYTGYMKAVGKKTPEYVARERLKDPNFSDTIYEFSLKKTPAKEPFPRYGVTYDDIATPEERAMWIAGSSLNIIDLKTNEIIAERIGYMFDRGMGANGGGRSPWQHAAKWACPKFPGTEHPEQTLQTRHFTEQILKIKEP